MIQAHIYYSGMVQGVGFRYTVTHYARDLQLEGWVRNLPDGRVEMMIKGAKESVEALCKRIEQRFEGNVSDKVVEFSEAEDQFQGFQIVP